MLKLDNNLLDELGLGGLPEDQKRAMLQHIYDTLELRVGTNLANQMSDQQLEEFEKFIDDGGDANQSQALQWLEANLPHYKQVVNEVFEALKAEIKQMSAQILATSGSQPVQASPQGQGASMPMPSMPSQAPAQTMQNPVNPYNDQQQPVPKSGQPYSFPAQQPPAGPSQYQPPNSTDNRAA
jgi:hypothetical protein